MNRSSFEVDELDVVYHVEDEGLNRVGFVFFSSRRRHTRFDCDWSSDVCSSDLLRRQVKHRGHSVEQRRQTIAVEHVGDVQLDTAAGEMTRKVLSSSHRQIVDDDHMIAARDERVDEVTSDEPRSSGDRHATSLGRHQRSSIRRSTRAGFPATIVPAATLFVTTLPAPTMAFSPISTPQRIVAPDPIVAPRLTIVGTIVQSPSPCSSPAAVTALGNRSLMNVTPWPTKT